MDTIRIGNDINVSWALFTMNGGKFSLLDKEIQLWLMSGPFKKELTTYEIQSNNVVMFSIDANDLHRLGVYKLLLRVKDEAALIEDAAYDLVQMFQLVSRTYCIAGEKILDGSVDLYFKNVIKTVVTVDSGGEENVIERIKVNDELLPVEEKTVNVEIPITTVSVNGEEVSVEERNADIIVPTKLSDLDDVETDKEDILMDPEVGLQLANRAYDSEHPTGLGFVILRKNKSFAEQVTLANTIYEIRYDFNLGGDSVNIPSGCALFFNGGSVDGGELVFDNTYLYGNPVIRTRFSGSLANQIVETKWFDNDHVLKDVFAVSEGRTIEFECKEFQCAYAITIPSCVAHGNGATIRLLDTNEKASADHDAAFKIANKHFRSATEQDEIIIDHLHFVTASVVGVHLFALSATKNLHLDCCSFICEKPDVPDPTAIILHCFDLDGNDEDALIENCVFENHCDNGSTADGNGGGVWVRSLVASHPSNNITIRNCKIYNNCLDEMLGFLPLSADINNVLVDGCELEYERMASSLRVIEGTRNIAIAGTYLVNGITISDCSFHSNYLHNRIVSGNAFTDGLIKDCSFIVSGYMYAYPIIEPTFNSNGMVYQNCVMSFDVNNVTGNTQSTSKPTIGGTNTKYIGCRIHLGNSRLFLCWTYLVTIDSCAVDCIGALLETNSPATIKNSHFIVNLSAAGIAIGLASQSADAPAEWSNNTFRCVGARGNINFPATDALFTSRNNIYDNFLFSNYVRQTRIDDQTPYGRGNLLRKPAYVPGDFTNGSVSAGDYFVVKGEIKLTSGLFLLANTTLDFSEGGKISGSATIWLDSTRIIPEGRDVDEFITATRNVQSGKTAYATGQVLYRNNHYEMWNGTAWVKLDGTAF